MFQTLQEAQHFVHTAYGDSDTSFGGLDIIPMHGIGQGNGSSPAIWAVVSTPILNMLRQTNVGSFLRQPISLKPIRFSGFSFVDDTDTIQTARDNTEGWQEVVQGLQHSLDMWQVGLHATGGAIIPVKTSWKLTDFKWQGGNWSYRTLAEMPATLKVKVIDGIAHALQKLDHNQATLSLGVNIAPDGTCYNNMIH